MTKADKLRDWALSKVGCGYIWGATGYTLTSARYNALAEGNKTVAKYGARWIGKQCYDCAQLVRWGCQAAGIEGMDISGASSQWKRGAWGEKGELGALPSNRVCMLFRGNEKEMKHTGICLGDGTVVHAKGTQEGVVREMVSDGRWTHWAIPIDLIGESDMEVTYGTLKKGDMGLGVMHLQTLLMQKGYALIRYGADGKFGAETETAVRDYQAAQGLPATGACDAATWLTLEAENGPPVNNDAPPVDKTALLTELEGLNKRQAVIITALKGVK